MPKEKNLTYVTRIDPATEEMVPAQGKRKIFVSYKKDDNRMSGIRDITVKKILRMVDCAVWYDDGLTPGIDYKDEIIDAISQCDAVVLVLTRHILQSTFVWEVEVATAIEQKKGIIPLAFDLSPDDYPEVEARLGRRQILRWPAEKAENGVVSQEAMKFDQAFESALDRFVINADLALRVERFFLSGKHSTPAGYLNAEERWLMGYGYLKGLGVAADTEKGVALLDSVVHTYGDDKKTNEIKGNAALELDKHYYELEEYEKAFSYAEAGAKVGNRDSMNRLGCMYDFGGGVAQDKTKAVEWYTKAAELGNAKAMLNLGVMYVNGEGVAQDKTKAVEWYTKAAELGNANAMFNLGYMYNYGNGVAQNKAKAVEWYTKAAELGNANAMFFLGACYDNGDGVAQDKAKAVEWYTKAAELGNANAMFILGVCYYFNGNGIEQNKAKAVEWYTKAAELGHEEAKRILELMFGGRKAEKAEARAAKLAAKAEKKRLREEKRAARKAKK